MWKWQVSQWECGLLPVLTVKAIEAYIAMDVEMAHYYIELKAASSSSLQRCIDSGFG